MSENHENVVAALDTPSFVAYNQGIMLAQEVLVLDVLRRGRGVGLNLARIHRHFRHFLQHHRVIDRLCGILAPGERPV